MDTASAINDGIGIDDFAIPACFGNTETISVSRNRREIAHDNDEPAVFIPAQEREYRTVQIVVNDPFEAVRIEILFV